MDSTRTILKKIRESAESERTADSMYREYLEKHISRVKVIYDNILKPILVDEGISTELLESIEVLIKEHDRSKYEPEEFIAYRDHFYNPEANPRSGSEDYDHAWNRHQKNNPHHWQYWCLINDVDEPQVQPLNMPFQYIAEMLCDWHSAGAHYGNTAYDWYEKQKEKMILTDTTRSIIEKYIGYFK